MGVKAGWPDFYFRPEARKAIATLHFDGIYLKPNTEKTVLTAEYSGVLFGFGFMVRCPDGGIDHFYIRVKVDGLYESTFKAFYLETLSGIMLSEIAADNPDKYVTATAIGPLGGMTCYYYDGTKGTITFGGGFVGVPFEFTKKLEVIMGNEFTSAMTAWLTVLVGRHV